MRRLLLTLLVLAGAAWAANIKLYLKDGGYQIVREYQVETDRVRFYSVERGQWEEIPVDLVDLKRTEGEVSNRQAELEKEAKIDAAEEKVERESHQVVSHIPQDPGVYWREGNQTKVLKQAESTVHNNKGRSVLQHLAPVPLVPGKATLEVAGAHSETLFTNPEQEFFIQLAETERFGIAKLTTKGAIRIVENLTVMPVTKEVDEQPVMVEVFQQQLTPDGLYKIWTKEPLQPGEYAVIEYTAGKVNMQIWDFAMRPAK